MAKAKMLSLKFSSPVISGDCIIAESKAMRYLKAIKKANRPKDPITIELKKHNG